MLEKVRRFFAMDDSDSYSISSSSVDLPPKSPQPPARPRGHIVNLAHVARRPVPLQQIILLEPMSDQDTRDAAEALRQKKPIIVNVRKTEKDVAKRIVDFFMGISYAIDGHMHKIADGIFVFAPSTVEVTSHGGGQSESQREQDSLFTGA